MAAIIDEPAIAATPGARRARRGARAARPRRDAAGQPDTVAPSAGTDAEPTVLLSTISVRALSVAADIGVYAHEIGQPQTLLISVTLHVRAARSDSLADATDYTRIAAAAEALATERIALIESFAYRLATTCLAFTGVEQADVLVEKPGAIANGMAGTHIILRRAGV